MSTRRSKQETQWKSAAARRLRELAGPDVASTEAAVGAVVAKLLDGVPCPPTSLEALCDRLGVVAIDDDATIPVAGQLVRDGRGYRIVCAAGQPEARRRFTIAHELAHAVFEQSGPRFPRTGDELERLCNLVAAEMLMPRSVFEAELPSVPRASDIACLASRYRTSVSATAIRCVEFRPISVFAVEDGRVTWSRGHIAAGAIRGALEKLMRQAFDGEDGDGLVFAGVPARTYRADWIKASDSRRAIFVLGRAPSG